MQPFRTILFAADFSDNSVHAFRIACALAVEDKTRLIVLHVIEPDWVAKFPLVLAASIGFGYGHSRDTEKVLLTWECQAK